jgi:uncharacterized metal-binding protein YceD (DUF177 family)
MSVQINVLQELRQPLGTESSYDLVESELRLDGTELQRVQGSVTLLRTNRGLLASFKVRAAMPEVCVRCLRQIDCEVDFRFDEEFVATVDPTTGARVHADNNEDSFRISSNFVLDL